MEKTALFYPEQAQKAEVVTPEKDQVAKAQNDKKRAREEQVTEAPERVREIWISVGDKICPGAECTKIKSSTTNTEDVQTDENNTVASTTTGTTQT